MYNCTQAKDARYSSKTSLSIECVVFELIEQLSVTYVNMSGSVLDARWFITFKHTSQSIQFCANYHRLFNWLECYMIDRTRAIVTSYMSCTLPKYIYANTYVLYVKREKFWEKIFAFSMAFCKTSDITE